MTDLGAARDYLASLNPPLAIANSRGRFSGAAIAELENQVGQGNTFIDWPKKDIVVTKKAATKSKPAQTVSVKAVSTETPYETPDEIWPEYVQFGAMIDNKFVETGYREVCANCRRSLRWCYCRVPIALVGQTQEMIVRMSKATGREITLHLPAGLDLPGQVG